MSRRMAFLHLPPIRWLTSFYNPPSSFILHFRVWDLKNVILLAYNQSHEPLIGDLVYVDHPQVYPGDD